MEIEKPDKHRKVTSPPFGGELREHLRSGTKVFESHLEYSLLHNGIHGGKNILLKESGHHNFSLEKTS